MKNVFKNKAVLIFLFCVVLSIICSLISDVFFTYDNLYNISRNFSFIAIIAIGMTIVLLTGGIDVSVGSIMAVTGIITAIILNAGYSLVFGIAGGLCTALACGLLNGILITYIKLPAFIVTLASLSALRSLSLVILDGKLIYSFGPDEEVFLSIGGGTLLGLAIPVWILAICALIFSFILNCTKLGKHFYAVGSNENSARLAGINVTKVKLSAYLISALMAGISAILMVSWLGSITSNLGLAYELDIIAASVIGGASLFGGVGNISGSIAGAALLEVIRNFLLLVGIDSKWQGFFVGFLIIVSLIIERIRKNK